MLLGVAPVVGDGDVRLEDRFLAPGYGQLNDSAIDAIALLARHEGILLDPVYSAKTMAGFISIARNGPSDRSLLFIHTGGTPALFAYGDGLVDAMNASTPDEPEVR